MALHELGHFVGRRLEEPERIDDDRWTILRPFEGRLTATGDEVPADWHHLREFFADAYAVYVGGPAYLGSCVSVALYPSDDLCIHKTHPGPSRRLAIVLEILNRMDAFPDNTASLAFERDGWRAHWVDVTNSAGEAADLVLRENDSELVEFLWTTLHERLRNARYRTLNTAKELAGRIRSLSDPLDGAIGVAGASAVDALNAAWCARRQVVDGDIARLEQRSRRLLKAVTLVG